MSQDLNELLFFAEVVDRGSFSAAGRALHIPKSRLSRRIAGLEARLGVRLLQRTTRSVTPTDAGAAYYRHCLAVREASRAAEEAVSLVRNEPSGTIRLSCPITLSQTVIGPLLPPFLANHPRVKIEMVVSNRVVDVVREGIDLALRVRSIPEDVGSLVVRRLAPLRTLLVGSPALLERASYPPSEPDDLLQLPTVAMQATQGTAKWVLQGPARREATLVHRPVVVADDLLTLKHAMLGGVGFGVLPASLCNDELAQGQLAQVLPGWAPPAATIYAAFPTRRGMLPAIRRFLDFLALQLSTLDEVQRKE